MTTIYRGKFFHLTGDPFQGAPDAFGETINDGALVVGRDGLIKAFGPWASISQQKEFKEDPSLAVVDLTKYLMIPGLIDTHLHFPQLSAMGAYGEQLLSWLQKYIFPIEASFSDPQVAAVTAKQFWQTLARHGTTMSALYSSLHADATQTLMEEGDRLGVRSIVGKTMMDRLAPDSLLETVDASCSESESLYLQWRNHARIHYAFTPRFAPSCTPELLQRVGQLCQKYPNAYLQSHLSENQEELKLVKQLFPDDAHYTAVYHRFGLLHSRSIMGHGIWLNDDELELLRQTKTVVSHCPVSNLFLGSGMFPLRRVQARGVRVALASDIAGGNSPSMFKVMDATYKIQQILGNPLHPYQLLYLATTGNAEALSLDHCMGNFMIGKEANFLALDLNAIEEMSQRMQLVGNDMVSTLAAVIFLGDDRMVRETYVLGQPHKKS